MPKQVKEIATHCNFALLASGRNKSGNPALKCFPRERYEFSRLRFYECGRLFICIYVLTVYHLGDII